MIKLLEDGEFPNLLMLTYSSFLRAAMDYRLRSLLHIIFEARNCYTGSALPNKLQLKKLNLDAKLLTLLEKRLALHLILSKNDSSLLSGFIPFSLIFRIQRDFLFNSANRELRLLAGIKEEILKAKLNHDFKLVYL